MTVWLIVFLLSNGEQAEVSSLWQPGKYECERLRRTLEADATASGWVTRCIAWDIPGDFSLAPAPADATSVGDTQVLRRLQELKNKADALDTSRGLILQKSQYDAFYNTELVKILRENFATQVVITGVMTHLCCETAARSAFVRGFDVFFTVDGTATYNEDFHRAALQNLAHGFATPVLLEEFVVAQHAVPLQTEK